MTIAEGYLQEHCPKNSNRQPKNHIIGQKKTREMTKNHIIGQKKTREMTFQTSDAGTNHRRPQKKRTMLCGY